MKAGDAVVLDTSALFPALFDSGSAGRKVLRGVLAACCRLALSQELRKEYMKVIQKGGHPAAPLERRLRQIESIPGKLTPPIDISCEADACYPTSPGDHHVVATAICAARTQGSSVVVARNDKHFLRDQILGYLQERNVEPMSVGDAADKAGELPQRFPLPPALGWLEGSGTGPTAR
ncbi:MAG: hypothetical protein HY744_16765 [Deltaproteobacteria bacterium]|nr:hypothetical protein [Deltaproteobacteria bacterium]